MTEANRRLFDSMSAAFDWVRETNRPQRAVVAGELWKLYPSGRAEKINPKTEKPKGRDGPQ